MQAEDGGKPEARRKNGLPEITVSKWLDLKPAVLRFISLKYQDYMLYEQNTELTAVGVGK